MNRHLITLLATFAASVAFADADKKDTTKAEAKSNSTTTTTTNINGKVVTVIKDQDEQGKERVRMITQQGTGKPKVKDITPKEKQPAKKDDPLARLKPVKPEEK